MCTRRCTHADRNVRARQALFTTECANDIEAHGAPFVAIEPAAQIGQQHCNFIIYKDKSKVPAKYYERLGLKKPE